jgi:UDP-N-acetylglucosamine 2-epimerase (non-hydrolysing)
MKILLCAGTRPNFVKIAPLIWGLSSGGGSGRLRFSLVHTGQHQDYLMSGVFFADLDIPEPDHFLNAGNGNPAEFMERAADAFTRTCRLECPDLVMVAGDVNSTLACALAASREGVAVAHVESGLRSGDLSMPEEANRIRTDAISEYLFVTEPSGIENLRREGLDGNKRVHLVGNTMIDALYRGLEKLKSRAAAGPAGRYAVVTLHRQSNVDDRGTMAGILEAFAAIARDMPVFFPVHPRTAGRIDSFGLEGMLVAPGLRVTPPMGYLDFLSLLRGAALVLTDSGGVQEETTALNIPCLTVRKNTERPVTVEVGTNTIAGTTPGSILDVYGRFRDGGGKPGARPQLWDGRAAHRILEVLGSAAGGAACQDTR